MRLAVIPESVVAVWPALSLPAKAIVVSIASFMNRRSKICWPGIFTLMKHAGLKTPRVVRGALRELVDAGVLTMKYRPGKSYLFSWCQPPGAGVPRGGNAILPYTQNPHKCMRTR